MADKSFDNFKKRYLKSGGNAYETDEWIALQMSTGRSPSSVAYLSRYILPYAFDEFVEKVKNAAIEEARRQPCKTP